MGHLRRPKYAYGHALVLVCKYVEQNNRRFFCEGHQCRILPSNISVFIRIE